MYADFEYGTIAKGIYIGLLWLTVLLGFVAPELLLWHLALLLFLGVGLKPLLLKSGLYGLFCNWRAERQRQALAPHHAAAARRVERQRSDERKRQSRAGQRNLPPRW